MAVDMSFLVADEDYYEPWDAASPGVRYQAGPLPAGWTSQLTGVWTYCSPAEAVLADSGWKVHVSSSLANARHVLSVVSAISVELSVPFKHLAGHLTFLALHGKHGTREQAGKFCALYPPDLPTTWQLLRRLEAALSGVSGPYVLTDRRFGSSECVSYRYGAFRGRHRIDAEGNRIPVLIGPTGEELDDQRKPVFHLPPGVSDPFRPEPKPTDSAAPRPVVFHGYVFEKVIRHSNAGGAYRFRSEQGVPAFIKEARAHNGYTEDGTDAETRLQAEYLTLRAIHSRAPGLCPEPIKLFHHWEQRYLITEWIDGESLHRWMVTNHPALHPNPDPVEFEQYYQRCSALLDQLEDQLSQLHELGFVFVDVSPNNVLVDEDERVRLIDFEAVQPSHAVRRIMGTPGYHHPDPRSVADQDPEELDRFGLSALALLLLFPVHETVERHPPVLSHLHADLTDLAPVPAGLWQLATRYRQPVGDTSLPTPEAVRDDPVDQLRWLARQTADALEAMAQPDHPVRVYPTIPLGYQTDTRSLATGTAGVLYALRQAGRPCDPVIVRRLRDEALKAAGASAPGLLFGTAGIACVLAELGEPEAAERLLSIAAEHPLNRSSATLGGGAAGTALGLLLQHRRTGQSRWLELADRLLRQLPEHPDELATRLSNSTPSGLATGRPGVALALYYLYRGTGNEHYFRHGMRLLGDELSFGEPSEHGLQFVPSRKDARLFPYLFTGSAGYAAVLSRYLADRPGADFRFSPGLIDADSPVAQLTAADALERSLHSCSVRFTAFPGLFPGQAGLALVQAEAGRRLGRPDLVEAAYASARGLFRHAIPTKDGVGWLGEPGQRLSAELWSGSAGVLLALCQLTEPGPGLLSSLDSPHP